MKCVITGARGATGKVLMAGLTDLNFETIGLARGTWIGFNELRKNSHLLACDVSGLEQIKSSVNSIISRFKRIDCWVNAVGGFSIGNRIQDTSDSDWDKMWVLNYITTFNCCKVILPLMNSQKFGRIINFGSRAGEFGMAKAAPYSLSKAAVHNLSLSIAKEAGRGVTCNVLIPEIIDTPANRKAMPKADISKWTHPGTLVNIIADLFNGNRNGGLIHV
jgi:NAD(P)-dependent dehydrogenase (short-subunit alcohol dehydrogenase family)